jgi:hypothetical protein
MKRFAFFLAFALACLPARALEKWVYIATNLLVDENVDKLETLLQRASAARYTHVLFTDSKLTRLSTLGDIMPRYQRNTERVKQSAGNYHLEIVPCVFQIGYSNSMLFNDPNLVEGPAVKALPLVVQDGLARVDDSAAPTLPGGDFSDLKKWSWKDDNVVAEDGAARVTEPKGANARIVQKLRVQPWRQYHVSVRVKTQDFGGQPEIKVLPAGSEQSLQWQNLGVKRTQDWTVHYAVFNSLQFTDVSLFFGAWGGSTGSLWWDDAKIEEVAFVNLIRRPGAPLVLTTADGKPLVEGRDFEPLRDPLMGTKPWPGEYDAWHEPPLLRTKLPDGTKLLASYYHAATVYDGQAMICPSEPKTLELLRDEAKRVHALWGAKSYMMSHDECRVMNWCAACEARHLTPGQLLADNVQVCTKILREVNPGGRIYTWSDMFDPNHNAVKGPYYLVNGPLTGSWEGLDKDIIIVPWFYDKRAESLRFFAGRGHKQVIAGYYDSEREKVGDWLSAAKEVPGSVLGVMYTTWKNDYSNLEKFSATIDAAR